MIATPRPHAGAWPAPAARSGAGGTAPAGSAAPGGTGLAATSPRACKNAKKPDTIDRRRRTVAADTPPGSTRRVVFGVPLNNGAPPLNATRLVNLVEPARKEAWCTVEGL